MGKLKEYVKPAKIGGGMNVPKIKKGETIITLTNIHTGEKKVYHDTNMQTNALNHYLANCGWLNRDNLQDSNYRNRLAEEILGGVMLFDKVLPANAECIKVPAGTKMIANCALGAVNTESGTGVTELGTCSTSPTETGRINGKYIAYKLKTPETETITPTNLPIKSLSGYNHIESSTGDMEVEYITEEYQPLVDLIETSSLHYKAVTAQEYADLPSSKNSDNILYFVN